MKRSVWLGSHIVLLAVIFAITTGLLHPHTSLCARAGSRAALPTAGMAPSGGAPGWGAAMADAANITEQAPGGDADISPNAIKKYKNLCRTLGLDEKMVDLPAVKEGIENLQRYPCTGCSYSFSLHKLLDTVNKIWAKVRTCDCTLLTDIDTKVDHILESCCDGGGGLSCAELLELMEQNKAVTDSVYDVVTDTNTKVDHLLESCCDGGGDFSSQEIIDRLDSIYDVVVDTNSKVDQFECCSLLEPIYSVVEETNSLVEEISTQLPCNLCDVCIKQSDVDAAGGTYTISSGGTYCVAENLSSGNDPVIDITGNDVTLDLHGHTITGGALTVSDVLINTGTANVTVKNGSVTGAANGIQILLTATDWTIQDIHVLDNRGIGIFVQPSAGAGIRGTISGVIARDNGSDGIRLNNGPALSGGIEHIHVRNSVAQHNGTGTFGNGFTVFAGAVTEMVTFESCVAANNGTGNTGYGFLVSNAGVIFKDCMAVRNNDGGFEVQGSASSNNPSSAVFQGCVALGNQNNGFHADDGGDHVKKSIVIKNCISANSQTTTEYEFDINARGVAIADSIAMSGLADGTPDSGGFQLRGISPTLKNCIAISLETSNNNGFYIPSDTGNTSGAAIFDGCISNTHANGIVVSTNTDLTSLVVRSCTATGFSGTGFLSQLDAATVFKDCIGATSQTAINIDGLNIDSSGGTRDKLVENCAMIGDTDINDNAGFLTNGANVTYRGNTAIGWEHGFLVSPVPGPPGPAYFNNLARNNGINFSGVDDSLPTTPGTGGYFITAKDNTGGGGLDRRVPWSDLTGYWSNMADPN